MKSQEGFFAKDATRFKMPLIPQSKSGKALFLHKLNSLEFAPSGSIISIYSTMFSGQTTEEKA
jgi:ABC-type polar amino acid transport system ATPase subunit